CGGSVTTAACTPLSASASRPRCERSCARRGRERRGVADAAVADEDARPADELAHLGTRGVAERAAEERGAPAVRPVDEAAPRGGLAGLRTPRRAQRLEERREPAALQRRPRGTRRPPLPLLLLRENLEAQAYALVADAHRSPDDRRQLGDL